MITVMLWIYTKLEEDKIRLDDLLWLVGKF